MIYNRKSGEVEQEVVFDEKKMHFMYNTLLGSAFTYFILKRRFFSKIYSRFQKTNKSKRKIMELIHRYNINTNEITKEITDYESFNDFIIRDIKQGSRQIAKNRKSLISPADSLVLAYEIKKDCIVSVKNKKYTISQLLNNKALANDYIDGLCLIFRLAVYDYHHFCFIDDGKIVDYKKINGNLHSVNSKFTSRFVHTTNYREVSVLNTENFDDVIHIDIGAMLVGKIVQIHNEVAFKKGSKKGYFEFGGSTIVLLLKKGIVKLDDDIIEYSKKGIEIKVKMGERIGVSYND